MYTVKFECPTAIVANSLAILGEDGKIAELINTHLERVDLGDGNRLDDSFSDTEYDDLYSNHTVILSL